MLRPEPHRLPDSYPEAREVKLCDERQLEQAEQTLVDWAYALAAAGRDSEAAEAIRVANTLLNFRCSFLEREKRQGAT